MSGLNEYFLNSYTPPELIISKHEVLNVGDISEHLKSHQTITLSNDEFNELVKDKDFWFYESDMEIYDNLGTMRKMFEDGEFDNIKDGHGISEYIGVYEKYIPSLEYLQYIFMNKADVVMNVYDAYNLYNILKRNEILRDKIVGQLTLRYDHSTDYTKKVPNYEFVVPKYIKYTKFENRKYDSSVLVSCFQDPVPILSVNLPYQFYLYQPIPYNIYTFDIDENVHKFGSLSHYEFEDLLNDICNNGITKPLFMRMNGEVLTAVDEETNIILLIAKLLKLPSIPVNIYLSNEDIGKNHLMDAIIENDKNQRSLYNNIGFMKNVFEPFMIVNKENEYISCDNIEKYTVFSTNNNLVVRYLNTNDLNDDKSNIDEFTEMHNKMHNAEVESINNEIDKIIKALNGQE